MSAPLQLARGPWVVVPEALDESGEPLYFAILDANKREVANTCGGGYPTKVERQHANVLAAAPELLAALQRLMDGPTTLLDAQEAAKQARAAINKATGSTS